MVQIPPRGVWGRSKQATWAAVADWLGAEPAGDADPGEALRRYVAAFGPASPADMRAWSGLTGVRPPPRPGEARGPLRPPGAPRPGPPAAGPPAGGLGGGGGLARPPARPAPAPARGAPAALPARVRQRAGRPRGPLADHPAAVARHRAAQPRPHLAAGRRLRGRRMAAGG